MPSSANSYLIPIFGQCGRRPAGGGPPVQPGAVERVLTFFKSLEDSGLGGFNCLSPFIQNDAALNSSTVIVHILPGPFVRRFNDEIQFQVKCIKSRFAAFERHLEVDVITQKLIGLILPKENFCIVLSWLHQQK